MVVFTVLWIGSYWKQLETSKKGKTQGSSNGTIILNNKTITKVECVKCYNHQTMASNN
jgi:hypothetical protein